SAPRNGLDERARRRSAPIRCEHEGHEMGNIPKLGSAIDRRSMIRGAAGAGLALPFGVPALARAQDHDHGSSAATPTDGYVGSSPSEGGTGSTAPVATEILPFERYDPWLPAVDAGPKTINMFAGDRTLYIAEDVPYAAWTFDGSVPGNKLRARVGDEVTFNFH